ITDVGSAERLARTTTHQPLTDGTRTSNQTTRRSDKLSDTSRDTCDNSRLLLPARASTIGRICRRPGPPQNKPDDKRRRNTNTTAQERLQNPRTILRLLFRQEERRTIQ